MPRNDQKLDDLLRIISRLRAPEGCPWDQKQTPQSFKPYVLEEAHELLEAIDRDDPEHIKEELGDLLFQVAFLVQLYAEGKHFAMSDVIEAIAEKMIRRHPHVFEGEIMNEAELRKNWHAIKAKEKNGERKISDILTALPKSFPALRRAQRISERVARTGLEGPDTDRAFEKLAQGIRELKIKQAQGDKEGMTDSMGNVLFTLVNLGRRTETNCEDALERVLDKFINRFARLETMLEESGESILELDAETLNGLWQKTKNI